MTYYEGVKKMEEMGVNDNYPELEEQRITDEWESGYEDGKEKTDTNFANFC